MKIYIKNMVSQGTRSYILRELERLGLKCRTFVSGEIDFEENLSSTEIKKLDQSLRKYGLEVTFRQDK
jgi:biotin operon repressor